MSIVLMLKSPDIDYKILKKSINQLQIVDLYIKTCIN